MEGYEVVTPDEDTVGRVVERKGDYLVVEHGVLRKSRHAIPWSTVEIDDAEQKARTSLAKEFIETSPKLENSSPDERALAAHYGLGADTTAPATEGYGVTEPTDPARSAERDAVSAGMEAATEERARVQKEMPRQEPELLDVRRTRTDEQDERA